MKDWSIVSFEHTPFSRVYTGHFHSKQQIGENVWYPGSLIPFKFDEGDVPHGFYVYDTEDNTHKFVNIWKAAEKLFPGEIAPPQFKTILESAVDQLTEGDVANNLIRIALERDYSLDEKRVLRDRLRDMGARAVRWLNLAQKVEVDKREVATHENRDLFTAWIDGDEKGTKDLDKGILHSIHNEVIVEGDELYVAEESESW